MVTRYNPDIHHRRSVRLKGYDYCQAGTYFVTICAHGRQCLFGRVEHGIVTLNEYGQIVAEEWLKTAAIRPDVVLGEYVVMPIHFHGMVVLTDDRGTAEGDDRGTARRAPTMGGFAAPVAGSLSTIIRAFKSAVTKCINEIRQTRGTPVWQRNYYEHIVRDEADYTRIAGYIADNPRRWAEDSLNPDNTMHPHNPM